MPSASFVPHRAHLHVVQALGVALLLLALTPIRAEVAEAPRTNYKQAFRFSASNLRPLIYDSAVSPNWIGASDTFWYAFHTSKGTLYWRVDAVKKTKAPLFDRDKLAGLLAEISRKPVDAVALPIARGQVSADGKRFTFVSGEMQYDYDLQAARLVQKGKAPPVRPGAGGRPGRFRRGDVELTKEEQEKRDKERVENGKVDRTKGPPTRTRAAQAYAPDRKAFFSVDKFNLFLTEVGKEKKVVQLTKDGGEDYSFVVGQVFGRTRGAPDGERSVWSKDSKYFYALRQDVRGVKELFVINSLASPRPTLEKYKYPMPGEEAVRKGELHVGSRESKKLLRVQPKWKDESYSDLHWGKAAGELRFIRHDRLRRNLELCAVDVDTGDCKALIAEGFENAPVDHQPPRYLEEADEMIWWSEKSGWGHFYLYDRAGQTEERHHLGPLAPAGSWPGREEAACSTSSGNAREPGENVYYRAPVLGRIWTAAVSRCWTRATPSTLSTLSPTPAVSGR